MRTLDCTLVLGCIVVATTLACYTNALTNGFLYDDIHLIIRQAPVRETGEYLQVFWEPHYPGLPHYRPIVRLTFMLQKTWYGNDAFPFRLINIGMVAASGWLLLLILRRPGMNVQAWPALLGTIVFVVHPVTSSCVNPIASGRESLMPGLFMLAGLWFYLHRGVAALVLTQVCFLLALGSKEQAVVFPLALMLADLTDVSGRPLPETGQWREVLWRYAFMWAVVLAYLAIRHYLFSVEQYTLAILHHPMRPPLSYVYALQTIWAPFIRHVYEPPEEVWVSLIRIGVAGVATLGVAVVAARSGDTVRRVCVFWAGWFLLTLLPTANMIWQETNYDERFVYMPLAAMAAILASILSAYWKERWVRVCGNVIAVVLIMAAAGVSRHRAAYFANELTFYQQWLRTNPSHTFAPSYLGNTLLQQRRYDDAIDVYDQALDVSPSNMLIYIWRGDAKRYKGSFDSALEDLNTVLDVMPDFLQALNDRAAVYAAKREYTNALKDYARIIAIYSNVPALSITNAAVTYNNQALVYLQMREYVQALTNFAMALALAPNFTEALNNRGLVHHELGNYRAALDDFNRAILLNVRFAVAYNNRARTHIAMGNYEQAVRECSMALRMGGDFPQAHKNKGIAYKCLGALTNALEALTQALRLQPDYVEALVERGDVHAMMRSYEHAIADHSAAIAVQANPHAFLSRGDAYLALGRFAEATNDYTAAMVLVPHDPYPWYARARALLSIGAHAAALADLDQAIRVNTAFLPAYLKRAYTYTLLEEYAQAWADCETAEGLEGGRAETANQRGLVLQKQGALAEALQEFTRAIERDPTYAEAYYDRAVTHLLRDEYQLARADMRRALELGFPANPVLVSVIMQAAPQETR